MNMKALKGEGMTGTDAEACAYLMTVSLTQPMDSDWTQIYLYVAGKTYRRWGKNEMPADIRVDSLTDYQLSELRRFKDWLYQKRTQARQEREREERRQEREQKAEKKAEQEPVSIYWVRRINQMAKFIYPGTSRMGSKKSRHTRLQPFLIVL